MATGMSSAQSDGNNAFKGEFQFHDSYPYHERPPNFRSMISHRIVPRYLLGWRLAAVDILKLDEQWVYRDIDRIIAVGMPAAWKENGYKEKFGSSHIPQSKALFDGKHDSLVFFEVNTIDYQHPVEGELEAIKHVLNLKTDPEWMLLKRWKTLPK